MNEGYALVTGQGINHVVTQTKDGIVNVPKL